MKKNIVAAGLCFSIMAAGILSGCSLGDSVSETIESGLEEAQKAVGNTEITATPAATEAPKETILKLGKKAKVGDWTFKVTKAQVKKQIKSDKYHVFKSGKGESFVVVSLSATNKGKEEGKFLPSYGYSNEMIAATLVFNGHEYKPTDLLSYDKDLLAKSIKPLGSEKGIIAFEVPKKVAKNKGKLTLRMGTESDYVIYKFR